MAWILEQLANAIGNLFAVVIGFFVDSIVQPIGVTPDVILTFFPQLGNIVVTFQILSTVMLIGIVMWALTKTMLGGFSYGEQENLPVLVMRCMLAMLLIWNSMNIMTYAFKAFGTPFYTLTEYEVAGDTGNEQSFTLTPTEGTAFDGAEKKGDETTFGQTFVGNSVKGIVDMEVTADSYGDAFGDLAKVVWDNSTIGNLVKIIILIWALFLVGKKLIAFIMNLLERYVILMMQAFTSPLIWCTIASRGTAGIFKKWLEMFVSNFLLMYFECWVLGICLKGFDTVYSVTAEQTAKFGWTPNFILSTLLLYAMIRFGQNLDGHLGKLLNTAASGAGMGQEIMGAVENTMRPWKNALTREAVHGAGSLVKGGFHAAGNLIGRGAKAVTDGKARYQDSQKGSNGGGPEGATPVYGGSGPDGPKPDNGSGGAAKTLETEGAGAAPVSAPGDVNVMNGGPGGADKAPDDGEAGGRAEVFAGGADGAEDAPDTEAGVHFNADGTVSDEPEFVSGVDDFHMNADPEGSGDYTTGRDFANMSQADKDSYVNSMLANKGFAEAYNTDKAYRQGINGALAYAKFGQGVVDGSQGAVYANLRGRDGGLVKDAGQVRYGIAPNAQNRAAASSIGEKAGNITATPASGFQAGRGSFYTSNGTAVNLSGRRSDVQRAIAASMGLSPGRTYSGSDFAKSQGFTQEGFNKALGLAPGSHVAAVHCNADGSLTAQGVLPHGTEVYSHMTPVGNSGDLRFGKNGTGVLSQTITNADGNVFTISGEDQPRARAQWAAGDYANNISRVGGGDNFSYPGQDTSNQAFQNSFSSGQVYSAADVAGATGADAGQVAQAAGGQGGFEAMRTHDGQMVYKADDGEGGTSYGTLEPTYGDSDFAEGGLYEGAGKFEGSDGTVYAAVPFSREAQESGVAEAKWNQEAAGDYGYEPGFDTGQDTSSSHESDSTSQIYRESSGGADSADSGHEGSSSYDSDSTSQVYHETSADAEGAGSSRENASENVSQLYREAGEAPSPEEQAAYIESRADSSAGKTETSEQISQKYREAENSKLSETSEATRGQFTPDTESQARTTSWDNMRADGFRDMSRQQQERREEQRQEKEKEKQKQNTKGNNNKNEARNGGGGGNSRGKRNRNRNRNQSRNRKHAGGSGGSEEPASLDSSQTRRSEYNNTKSSSESSKVHVNRNQNKGHGGKHMGEEL